MRTAHASTIVGLFVALCATPAVALACSCGCGVFDVGSVSMSADAVGLTTFVEYDYMDQNKNWRGTSDAPAGDNEDKRIATDFTTIGLRYVFDRDWGFSVEVPYWRRTFRTTDEDSGEIETYTHQALGDIRLRATYSGFADDRSTGIALGLKLPTGDDSYRHFDPDTEIGSGSTDVIVGAYHRGSIDSLGRYSWFVDGQWQQPVEHKHSYRPGAEFDSVVGVSYLGWMVDAVRISPLLQIKAIYRDNDDGAAGDPDNSGYSRVLLDPGVAIAAGSFNVHADVGIPLYTHTHGDQLVAPTLWSLNVGYRF
jgi:hypothetical protein